MNPDRSVCVGGGGGGHMRAHISPPPSPLNLGANRATAVVVLLYATVLEESTVARHQVGDDNRVDFLHGYAEPWMLHKTIIDASLQSFIGWEIGLSLSFVVGISLLPDQPSQGP